jgi:hypothetical protein
MNENDILFWLLVVPTGIIVWGMALTVPVILISLMFGEKPAKPASAPCPHGHEDWGNCPDCCH